MRYGSVLALASLGSLALSCAGCAMASESAVMAPHDGFADQYRSTPSAEALTGSPLGGSSRGTPVRYSALPANEALSHDDTTATTRPADPRLVIYSAGFRVVVADVPGTLRSIQSTAERLGGYMQEIAGNAISIRVPAAQFNAAVRFVEESGEVVDRQVRAQDITEEMRDLRIRLENAEQLRKRLLEILAKAEKVEDTIKVESELARVAEQIDATKGKIRYLESQAAMSTIRVDLNAAVAQNTRGTGPRLPFSWVEDLGEGLVAGQVQQSVRKAGFFGRGPSFKPPAGFVRYFEEERQIDAMDANGLRLRVQRRSNVDKAGLPFWSTLIRRALVENRSLAVDAEETAGSAYVLRGRRDVGGKSTGYVLVVKRSDKSVAVFEAWGPKALFDASADALRAAGLSVNPG